MFWRLLITTTKKTKGCWAEGQVENEGKQSNYERNVYSSSTYTLGAEPLPTRNNECIERKSSRELTGDHGAAVFRPDQVQRALGLIGASLGVLQLALVAADTLQVLHRDGLLNTHQLNEGMRTKNNEPLRPTGVSGCSASRADGRQYPAP